MITLSKNQKKIIVEQLQPFLKRNDRLGLRSALSDLEDRYMGGHFADPEITNISAWLYEQLGEDYFKDSSWVKAYEFASSDITKMVLPSYIQSIEDGAFGESSISQIKLNEGLTHIRAHAFLDTPSLKHIVLPSSVRYIGDYAFWTTALESITFQGSNPCNIDASDDVFSSGSKLQIILPKNKELRFYGNEDSLENWMTKYHVVLR